MERAEKVLKTVAKTKTSRDVKHTADLRKRFKDGGNVSGASSSSIKGSTPPKPG